MKLSSVLIAVAVVACWGFNVSIGKIGVLQVPPLLFLTIRFILASLIFIPFAKIKKGDLKMLFLIALLLNVGHMGCIFVALKYLPVSSTSVLQQCEVPFAFIVAYLFGHESVNRHQVMGVILAFAGILCIFGIPDLNIIGLLAALASGVFWAFAQLAFKKVRHVNPNSFLAYTSLFSIPFLFLASLLFEKVDYTALLSGINYKFYISMSYQVLVLGVAMMMWQRVVADNGINKVTPFTLLHIIFGIMGGMIFFNEQLNIYIVAGASLIISGVAMTMIAPKVTLRQKLWNWVLRRPADVPHPGHSLPGSF